MLTEHGVQWGTTDVGNAKRLVAKYGENLRYCHTWETWLVWDGQRWKRDATGEMMRRAKATVLDIYDEVKAASSVEQRAALTKHATRSESNGALKAMLEQARSEPGIPVEPGDLDADPWLFNAANGTVDLRTGELRPHGQEDLITRVSPASYDPDAPRPVWDAFLDRVLDGDAELIEFVRLAVGYSLTGRTTEQVLFLLHGAGSNGKTTLLEVIRHVAGDYASQVPADTLMASSQGGGIPNDVARLTGARFVSAVETDEGRRLAEGLVKRVTGSDTISARFMRSEWFDFRPQFSLWLAANHLPSIRGTDDAIWRRIRLVPFTVQIPAAERDPHLEDKLHDEADGILSWAIAGAKAWCASGLTTPAAVIRASTDYRAGQDHVGDFIDECCHLHPAAWAPVADIYQAYSDWAEAAGEHPQSKRWLGAQLDCRGHKRDQLTTAGRARIYRGIGLATEDDHTESPLPLNDARNTEEH